MIDTTTHEVSMCVKSTKIDKLNQPTDYLVLNQPTEEFRRSIYVTTDATYRVPKVQNGIRACKQVAVGLVTTAHLGGVVVDFHFFREMRLLGLLCHRFPRCTVGRAAATHIL